jgi:hypothetical protein
LLNFFGTVNISIILLNWFCGIWTAMCDG